MKHASTGSPACFFRPGVQEAELTMHRIMRVLSYPASGYAVSCLSWLEEWPAFRFAMAPWSVEGEQLFTDLM